jgi:hypothetical protein
MKNEHLFSTFYLAAMERNANHSLSVTPMEPHGQALHSAIKTADKKHGGQACGTT